MHSLQSFPSLRRSSFLKELQDQMQVQFDNEMERERNKEVWSIHRILEKPPEARDSQDIDTLYEFVLQNGSTNKIFQGAQEIICKTICREMTLLELPPKGIVCYQGDYGDTFYIVIQGSVSLFIDSKKKLIVQNEENGTTSDRYTHSTTGAKSIERLDSEGNPLPENYGSFIKQIGSGGTFGELAVMDPTARRSCTIICDTPTSFICLKRGAYQRLIRITNSSQLDFTQVEYLETLFFFDEWPHGELTRLSNRLRHLNFPTDTFLSRVGSEANVVYFVYSGIVQESIPLVHYLNDNGTVYKCTRLENDSFKRSIQETGNRGKEQQEKKRIALELNLYQDHDICGEYPVLFNKPGYNTDLLAVTDVKTLIMDRETWRELFFMHGLEHIRNCYQKLRALAEARENWRQTRTKLALSNPGLVLTISTKAMMHDGKCMCSWCGSKKHITGDVSCPTMIASKKKQADKQKQSKSKAKKALEIGIKAQAVKNTLTFVHTITEAAQQNNHRHAEPQVDGAVSSARPPLGSPHTRPDARRMSIQIAAKRIISERTVIKATNQESTQECAPRPSSNNEPVRQQEVQLPNSQRESRRNLQVTLVRKAAVSDFEALSKASNKLYAQEMQNLDNPNGTWLPVLKVEEVRKSIFSEEVESHYRQTLVKKVKRLTTLKDYYDIRSKVLETMKEIDTKPSDERYKAYTQSQPRKPKIPKANRQVCTKHGNQPRPDRFNRKINRMLKKLRLKDHPLPVVEESLKDF
uniref:Cyclic nucleotide-binding domain-containing protein n=1 Tax=Globisporangium ultimum (strain ATCC 200006 / CBS 805.95 / DAOM BR144) TaxID=431595 RepID=K3WMS0_GLOUD